MPVLKKLDISAEWLWYKRIKFLDNAKGYDRNKLLKQLAFDAGKLIVENKITRKIVIGTLLAACRSNRLACTGREYISSGTSWVLKTIENNLDKGISVELLKKIDS